MSIIGRIGFWLLLTLFPGVRETSTANGVDGDLYFPHFTHGGPAEARWETVFTFTNNTSRVASSTLEFLDDLGSELNLDFGSGLTNHIHFAVPANGNHVIAAAESTGESVSGWARARSSVPVQATVHYRLFSLVQSRYGDCRYTRRCYLADERLFRIGNRLDGNRARQPKCLPNSLGTDERA